MHQSPLLATKLHIPPIRPELVSRPRLIARLNQGLNRRLTLVSAPAGFGKTTVITEWLFDSRLSVSNRAGTDPELDLHQKNQIGNMSPKDQKPRIANRLAWLSLDEGDNDPARFITYVVAALQRVDRDVGRAALAMLQAPQPPPPEVLLTSLCNDVAAAASPMVLVLDDYHVIESQEVDEAVTFLLDHLPPPTGGLHLVIASRADPTLPLSRLRARGQLVELREADLRFTLEEATDFLQRVARLPVSVDDVRTLERRTEGWVTGLQLAAVAMQGLQRRDQVAHFVQSFGGSHRFVVDYLVDEVLDTQTADDQAFLLQTSILERLTPPLCEAVVGRQDGQAVLERLEAANLFLIPLDNERRWYRYHHLFAELLRQRLRWTAEGRPGGEPSVVISDLHRRACAWCEKEGWVDDAFRHARAAGDTGHAVEILEEQWQEIVHRGELSWLRRALDSLGPEYTRTSPPLSMAYCWAYALTGAIDSIPSHLADIRAVWQAEPAAVAGPKPMRLAVIPSLVETMESSIALHYNQPEQAIEHAETAISLIPEDAKPAARGLLHGAAGYRLAQAHKALGEYEQACATLLGVLRMLKASENYYGVAGTVVQMATMYQALGRDREAIALCQDTLDYIDEHGLDSMPPSGMVSVALAGLQVDSGDLEEARKNLETGRALVEPVQSPEITNLVNRIEERLDSSLPAPQPLIEPLSARELEVLRSIALGLSNREIAERLFVTVSTVKGHNRRIFGKLQVQTRTGAVACARELGLL